MTILNVYMDENEKKKLQSIVKSTKIKSMSELVKNLIRDKVKIEEIEKNKIDPDIEIPDFVPKDKYVVFSNNSIVCIGDSLGEVTQKAVDKGVPPPYVIKFTGKMKKPPEFVFMSLTDGFASQYTKIGDHSYPLLKIQIKIGEFNLNRIAMIDTGATVCVLNDLNLPEEIKKKLKSTRDDEIYTVNDIMKKKIYSGKLEILDETFDFEFILSNLGKEVPFNFLLGRNILDSLDSFFFGKKQIFLLKNSDL